MLDPHNALEGFFTDFLVKVPFHSIHYMIATTCMTGLDLLRNDLEGFLKLDDCSIVNAFVDG